MTPQRLQALLNQSGRTLREMARLLKYASHTSLRQCLGGTAELPADKAAWVEEYAAMRGRLAEQEDEWLRRNPPP